mmetsp:Transcript_21508/g.67643  ORF Transcript_21508/g.67643 Transcript_21508/m.67643 type:complete len:111 (+) Transcript_21508:74-406(+)
MENPEMTGGFVVEMPNERFVLSRGGISFTAKSGSHKFSGTGQLLLSPLRVVFQVRKSVPPVRNAGRYPTVHPTLQPTSLPPLRRLIGLPAEACLAEGAQMWMPSTFLWLR